MMIVYLLPGVLPLDVSKWDVLKVAVPAIVKEIAADEGDVHTGWNYKSNTGDVPGHFLEIFKVRDGEYDGYIDGKLTVKIRFPWWLE